MPPWWKPKLHKHLGLSVVHDWCMLNGQVCRIVAEHIDRYIQARGRDFEQINTGMIQRNGGSCDVWVLNFVNEHF